MLKKTISYLNLDCDVEDYDKIHDTIKKDIDFKGTNLWILIFAIIIASIGLNMNSTAVIIGAMLISPLMGPINGMGYSIATYDFPLFRRAIKNFGFAVSASLVASTLYFAVTPVSVAHSELLARTSPTIYDVLIALFGGLAGIIAISSKQKGNVIPGVAIATALMPPLCTAGYGLATGHYTYFFGAFYLFTINTVFIGISSIVISQLLEFPIRTIVEANQKKKVNRWISFIITVTVIPSIYFGYGLVQKERFTENANQFTKSISVFEGNYLLKNEVNPGKKTIQLIYGGNSLTEAHKTSIKARAANFSLADAELIIKQGFSFHDVKGNTDEIDNLKGEINRLTLLLKEAQKQKENQAESQAEKALVGKQLLEEIKTLFPQVTSCSYAETTVFTDTVAQAENVPVIVLSKSGKSLNNAEKEKITNWLKTRLKSGVAKIYVDE